MPILRNPRHERFAQLLAGGKSARDGYELAGYRRSDSNGAWLAKKEHIRDRIAEINRETLERERTTAAVAAERAAVTRQSLIEMAEALYTQAKKAGQTAAAVAALKEMGVLSGIRIERSERGAPGEFDFLEQMDEAQLLVFIETGELPAGVGKPN